MKLINCPIVPLIALSIMTITLTACLSPTPPTELPAELADKAIAFGNPESDIVIVNTQGGPMPELAIDQLLEVFASVNLDETLLLNVHQAQTLNPQNFTARAITFEEAKAADVESVKMLAEVVQHYKDAGKRVYVVGISFGAFMAQDLLALQGNVADGYLIIVGRLDMPAAVWQEFAEGRMVGFANGVDIIEFSAGEAGMGGDGEFTDANMAKIAAGLGHKRYTALLNDTDLSNVVYVYGQVDEQVGRLTQAEIDFLTSKGATVVRSEGDHGETIGSEVGPGLELLWP